MFLYGMHLVMQNPGRLNLIFLCRIKRNLPYRINCPAQLICGEKDHAGSCIRYNNAWHKNTGIPIAWIKNAGHNSNTDAPEEVNSLIEKLINKI